MIKYLLSLILFFGTMTLQAQESIQYDFRTAPETGAKTKVKGVDAGYYYVSFNILGIKNAMQRKALERYFNANPNFKKVSINSGNEFHGWLKQSMHAKDVRPLLLAQGVDFKFDRYKFKGCYFKAAQQQRKLQMKKK